MKFDKEHIDPLLEALRDGQGRVRACKIANITHETLMNWMRENLDFSDEVKKAEADGNVKITDLQKRKIIEDKSWQSGAWWLERTDPEHFRQRQNIDTNQPIQIIITKEDQKL